MGDISTLMAGDWHVLLEAAQTVLSGAYLEDDSLYKDSFLSPAAN